MLRPDSTHVGRHGVSETIENLDEPNDNKNNNNDHWYKKPIGIVILTVIAGIVLLLVAALLKHLLPSIFK